MHDEYQQLILRRKFAMKIFEAMDLSWNGTHYTSIIVKDKLVPVTDTYIDKCITAYIDIINKIKLLEAQNEEHRENIG
jgi:hypothetical protein